MQTRDFVSVHDIVNMVLLLSEDRDYNGEVFNVGTGVKTSVIELADMIMDLFDLDMDIEFRDPMQGDIRDSYSDISKAKKVGYRPQIELKRGLKEISDTMFTAE
jgi:UDP-glucose 4-epimerase